MNEENQALTQYIPAALGNVASITKLDKTNFKDWAQDIEIELKLRRVYKAVTDENVDEYLDLQARRIILETMDKEHRAQVRGYSTAKLIMERLRLSYAEATAARKYRTLVKFFRYTKDPNDSIDAHIGKLDSLRADLLDMDFEIDEDIFLATIIGSLPSAFGNVMEAWELADASQRTKQNLIAKLLNKENDLKTAGQNNDTAFAVIKNKSGGPKMTKAEIEEKKKTSRCGYCKQIGHWHAECPKKLSQQPTTSTAVDKPETNRSPAVASANIVTGQPTLKITLNVGNSKSELESCWIIDSGATSNMSNQVTWFSKLQMFEKPMEVKVGDKNSTEVLGIGEIKFTAKVNGANVDGTLTDVLFVPELATNLISVGAISKLGVKTSFDQFGCSLTKQGVKILEGKKIDDDLYVMQMSVTLPTESALITKLARSADEWHEVLGHPSDRRMSKLLKSLNINTDADNPSKNCSTCPAGKGHRVAHPTRTEERADKVGEIVHLDLVHSSNKTEKNCYYLLSKDEFSEFCTVSFASSKLEVCDQIEKLIIDFEVNSGHQIKTIQTDNGSEFVNTRIKNLLLYERIRHMTSAPYVSQQNGIIERAVQTINNMARTMLIASSLPSHLASEAVKTACYLANRLPTTHSMITPFERFTGREPFLGNLVKFGEQAHMMMSDRHIRKYDARTTPCFVVGYTNRRNTYRAYVPSMSRVVITCDLIFAPHAQLKDPEQVSEHKSEKVTIDHLPSYVTIDDESEWHFSPSPSAPAEELIRSSTPLTEAVDEQIRIGRNQRPYINETQLQRFFDQYGNNLSGSGEADPADISAALTNEDNCNQSAFTAIENSKNREVQRHLLQLAISADTSVQEPESYTEAVTGPNHLEWKKAIQKELDAHTENETWIETERPKSGTICSVKWVFKLKRDKEGAIERFKARLVARGYEQRAGIDFKETYAPVACTESIRLLLCLAAIKNFHSVQFDITTAFLNGELSEDVFVEPPEGLTITKKNCLKLKKALYGLRQAPRAWNSKFNIAIKAIGLEPTVSDPCVYRDKEQSLFVLTYVDDGIVFAKTKNACDQFVSDLNSHFKTNIVDGSVFLGIEIERSGNGIKLSQQRYISEMLSKFNLNEARSARTPIVDAKGLNNNDNSKQTNAPYRAAIGSLLYLALNTRPDILFATIALSRHNNLPNTKHWHAVQRVMRYLSGTKELCLNFASSSHELKIDAYADADWGGSSPNGSSISGMVIMINGCPIVTKSITQKGVALSTCEAEYVAASDCVKELLFLLGLMWECGFAHKKPRLLIDNSPAVATLKNQTAHKGLRHIRLRYSFLKREYENNEFSVEHIRSEQQVADILTKEMTGEQLDRLLPMMGIVRHKTKNPMNLLAALCLLSVPVTSAQAITPLNQVEWIPSHYIPASTLKRQHVKVPVVDRCHMLRNSFEGELHDNDIIKKILDKVVEDCQDSRKKYYLPAIKEAQDLDYKHPRRLRRSNIGRDLRKAQSPGLFYLSALLPPVQSIAQYESEESAYNTVWEHEKMIDHVYGELKSVENRFKEIQQGNAASLESMRIVVSQLNETSKKNERLHLNLPMLMKAISDVTVDIRRDADLVWDLIASIKGKKVDINILAKMSAEGLSEIKNKNVIVMSLLGVTWMPKSSKLGLTIDTAVPNSDAVIYKAIVFKEWLNDNSYSIYTGEKLMIRNNKYNCSKLISEPDRDVLTNFRVIFRDCQTNNQTITQDDLKLKYIKIGEEDRERETRPIVIKVGNERLIQCYHHNITLNETQHHCDKTPFCIPASEVFSIDGQQFQFEQEETNLTVSANSSRKIDTTIIDAAFLQVLNSASQSISEAAKHNENLREANSRSLILKNFEEVIQSELVTRYGPIACVTAMIIGIVFLRRESFMGLVKAQMIANIVGGTGRNTTLPAATSMPNLNIHIGNVVEKAKSIADIAHEGHSPLTYLYPSLGSINNKSIKVLTPGHEQMGQYQKTNEQYILENDGNRTLQRTRRVDFKILPRSNSLVRLYGWLDKKPPTPHPVRKIKTPEVHYAGVRKPASPGRPQQKQGTKVEKEAPSLPKLPPPVSHLSGNGQ